MIWLNTLMDKISKPLRIFFIVPYPIRFAPSQRFRFEHYLEALQNKGYTISVQSNLTEGNWHQFYKSGYTLTKITALLTCFMKRMNALFLVTSYDYVFIHRETVPIGPPVFEWIIAKILNKKIIYDFDDAVWLTDKTKVSFFEKVIRWRSKVSSICKWSYKVSCGNSYLADYARQFNPAAILNPTIVDTDGLHNPENYLIQKNPNRVVIGWTGSHSTLKYLTGIIDVTKKLQEKYPHLYLVVIADNNPNLDNERYEFIPWLKKSEAEDLMKIDIGVMPLPDDEWTRGKCGFKALQYMAMKIPCVVSPVGVNTTIVDHGITGFLASSEEDWIVYLEKLITDIELRKRLGEAGRKKVIEHYSVASNASNFLSLFE